MIPMKLNHGDNLANLFQKYNEVIDYLRQTRLVAGPGMRINKLASGITIESTATAAGGSPAAPPQGHPFDAELINKGTGDSPNYYVRIYNSELPDSPYAGIVAVGDWEIEVPAAELAVNTQNGFFVVLSVVYDNTQNPPFPVSLAVVPYGGGGGGVLPDEYTFRSVIAEGKTPDVASRMTGDITVSGRYI